jgi:paraquat-inducible protein B
VLSVEELIEAGLRAELATESFVTGQLLIELRLHPDKPAIFRGVKVRHPEIPSIPSDIQRVLETLQNLAREVEQNLDVKELTADIQGILNGANALINSDELRDSIAGVDRLINSEDTQQLAASLSTTLSEADEALRAVQSLAERADTSLDPVLEEFELAATELRLTLTDARGVLSTVNGRLEESSQLGHRLNRTLMEVEAASRSLRAFLDQLEQRPESLLWGKPRE